MATVRPRLTSLRPQVHGLALVQGVQEGGEMSAGARSRSCADVVSPAPLTPPRPPSRPIRIRELPVHPKQLLQVFLVLNLQKLCC